MRAHAAVAVPIVPLAACGGGGLSTSELIATGDAICKCVNQQIADAAGQGDTTKIQAVGTEAEKARSECRAAVNQDRLRRMRRGELRWRASGC
jgi:hypothetical protein